MIMDACETFYNTEPNREKTEDDFKSLCNKCRLGIEGVNVQSE